MKNAVTQKHFLVIDNGSAMLPLILRRLHEDGHTYQLHTYNPQVVISDVGYDAIVLSGGMAHEVMERRPDGSFWFDEEFRLIRKTQKPLLGICLGLQMITVALGGSLRELPSLITDHQELALTDDTQAIFGMTTMKVFEKHQWVADELPATLEVIQRSSDGIEMVRHKSRPFVGTQFHPEVSQFQFRVLCERLIEPTATMLADEEFPYNPVSHMIPSTGTF